MLNAACLSFIYRVYFKFDRCFVFMQLWREKLQTSFDINMGGGGYAAGGGDFRGGMQMRASGGGLDYHALASNSHLYNNVGMSGMNGLAMPTQSHHSLPHGSEVFMHGVRVRPDTGLPQTDGSADLQGDSPLSEGAAVEDVPSFLEQLPFSCPSAAANRRLPRKGDVSLGTFYLNENINSR
jgi:hypothetical protein